VEKMCDRNNCHLGVKGTGRAGAGTGWETIIYRTGTEVHELCGSLAFCGNKVATYHEFLL